MCNWDPTWLETLTDADYEREMILTFTDDIDALAREDLLVLAEDRCAVAAEALLVSAEEWEGAYPLPEEPEEVSYMLDMFPAEW